MNEFPEEAWARGMALSEEGLRRRQEILGRAQGALTKRVARRQMVRAGGAGAAGILLVLVVVGGLQWKQRTMPAPAPMVAAGAGQGDAAPELTHASEEAPPKHPGGTPSAGMPRIRVVIVQNDATVLARLRAGQGVMLAREVDDGELLAILHAAGRREGLIRIGGRVMLSSEVRAAAPGHQNPGSG